MDGHSSKIALLSFLIVEDNAFSSLVLTRTLKSLGASKIHTAQTGREGLHLLETLEPSPDVLLVDLRMPEMGGVEMIGRLGDRGYRGHVIVTSGVDKETLESVEQLARQRSVQILGCLPKPVEASALGELLAKMFPS